MTKIGIKINLNKSEFWICLILVAYNFFSKIPYITTRDLSWDEPFSTFYSQFSVPQIITEIFKGNNPPLYEIFLHYYTLVFGLSETALRMPSLLFSCGTVVFLFYSGNRLKGNWVGIFVSLLFIFNNLQFFYSLAARMYGLFSMLVAASVYFCILCYQEPAKKKYFYGLFTVNILLCYTHYFAGFVIVAEAIAWLVAFRNKLFFKYSFYVFLANALLAIPLLLVFKLRATGFVSAFEFVAPTPEIWKNIIMNLVNGLDVYNSAYSFLSMGIVAYLLICAYCKKIEFRNTYYFVLLFAMFALPLAFTWYYGNTFPLFVDRYYLYSNLALFLFFALTLSTFYRPLGAIWVPVFFIYILNIYEKNFTRMNTDYLLREWQGATLTAKKLQHDMPNAIVLISPLWADLGFSYYYDRNLFKSPENYNQKLEEEKVYRIWGNDSLKSILLKNKNAPIVYYADQSAIIDSIHDGNYRTFIRFGYVKDTMYFFPQCTNVMALHKKDSISLK